MTGHQVPIPTERLRGVDHAREDCAYPLTGCTGCVPIPNRSKQADPVCGCNQGVLVGQTYGYAVVPAGAVPVQRCDECKVFATDDAAAIDLAARWDTTCGYAEGGVDGDSGEDFPGDWWVTKGPA